MTRHYPRSHYLKQQQQQEQAELEQQQHHKEKGWYCKEHNTKYLCDICGHDNSKKQVEVKYYFVSG